MSKETKFVATIISVHLCLVLFIGFVLFCVASPLFETRKFHDGQEVYVHDGFHVGKSGKVTEEMLLPLFGRSYRVDTNQGFQWIDQSELVPRFRTCEDASRAMCDRWEGCQTELRHKSWCPLPTDSPRYEPAAPSVDWWKTQVPR